jgi:hypothetical protein
MNNVIYTLAGSSGNTLVRGNDESFGSLSNLWLELGGISKNNPIIIGRETFGANSDSPGRFFTPTNIIISDHYFRLSGEVQLITLAHELAHLWDFQNGGSLTSEFARMVTWGDPPTGYAGGSSTYSNNILGAEDFAESFGSFFFRSHATGNLWTDDYGFGRQEATNLQSLLLADGMFFDANGDPHLACIRAGREISPDCSRAFDRLDYFQWKLTGKWHD